MATQKGEELLFSDTTFKIRAACFKVWKEFGGAFKEGIVDRALTEALAYEGLHVENQKRIDVFFGEKKVGTYVPDKIVNACVLLELKAKPYLTQEDERQFWLYLKAANYKVGMLINFGSQKLEIKRRVYDKARQNTPRPSASLSA
ncbi:MAG: GxxExxY protein [Candidatus Harrisonbacteria bacterium]|nr:GxxExxY protein [Candidatus Harrisonbacteria bacterium]